MSEGALAQRSAFFEEAGEYTDIVAVDTDDGSFLISTSGRTVEQALFAERADAQGRALSWAIDGLRRVGRASVSGSCLVQAGANIGLVTVPAVLRHGFSKAVCFEPEPQNHLMLRLNCTWNGIGEAAEIHPLALSDADGEIKVVTEPRRPSGYRLALRRRAKGQGVPRASLDSLIREDRLDLPDAGLLWIAAHGHELEVLRGASELLGRGVPIVVEDARELVADEGLLDEPRSILEASYGQFAWLRSAEARFGPLSGLGAKSGGARSSALLLVPGAG